MDNVNKEIKIIHWPLVYYALEHRCYLSDIKTKEFFLLRLVISSNCKRPTLFINYTSNIYKMEYSLNFKQFLTASAIARTCKSSFALKRNHKSVFFFFNIKNKRQRRQCTSQMIKIYNSSIFLLKKSIDMRVRLRIGSTYYMLEHVPIFSSLEYNSKCLGRARNKRKWKLNYDTWQKKMV